MVKKIELFKSFRNLSYSIGILADNQFNESLLNWRNVSLLASIAVRFTTSTAFLLYKADNILDYGVSFYCTVTEFINVTSIVAVLCKRTNISELIDDFEILIEMGNNFKCGKFIN